MTTITATLAWTLAGLNLLILILLGTVAFLHLRGRRRDTSAVSVLVRTVKENEPQQIEAIRSSLMSQYGQDEGNAGETARKLVKLKKKFYKTIINIYIDKQREAFAALDQHLDELIMSYRTQMPIVEEDAGATPESAPGADAPQPTAALSEKTDSLSADIEALKRQNEQLQNDLRQTKQELESTITEYVSAYSGGADLGKARLDSEIDKIKQNHNEQGQISDAPAQAPEHRTPPERPQEGVKQDDDTDTVMSLSDALADNGIVEEQTETDRRETV